MSHSPFKKTTCLLLAILMTLSAASPALADLFAFVPVESKTAWSDGVLTAGAGGYAVNVTYGADAEIPEGTELVVMEIPEGTPQYDSCFEAAGKILKEDEKTVFVRFFDITLQNEAGERIEPAAPVSVQINSGELMDAENLTVVHFPDDPASSAGEGEEDGYFPGPEGLIPAAAFSADGIEGESAPFSVSEELTGDPLIDAADLSGLEMELVDVLTDGVVISFLTDGFSVYGIIGTEKITAGFLSADGTAYGVTVTYDSTAKIPNGSTLRITEFDDGSEEYEEAKKAVIADKIARDDTADINTFELAALDISIIGPDGEEIEPGSAVQVDLKIKQLPGVDDLDEIADTIAVQHHVGTEDGVVVDTVYEGGNEAVFRMDTDEETVASGITVRPETVDLSGYGAFPFEPDDSGAADPAETDPEMEVSFVTGAFSVFTITWSAIPGQPQATIHYVDESGSELTVSNSYFREDGLTQSPAYLIYDVDGYEYVKTTLGSVNGTEIRPILQYYNNTWHYSTDTSIYSNVWRTLNYGTESHRDVYVVYRQKGIPTDGGTPVASDTGEKPLDPSIHKDSVPNDDGTYNLSLSITGHTVQTEVEKLADVIVIFDVSTSMNYNMAGEDIAGQTYGITAADSNPDSRLRIAYDAVSNLTDTLLSKENSKHEKLIRMSLIAFSNTAEVVQGFTEDADTFKDAVGDLTTLEYGGTNWEAALRLANTAFTAASDPDDVGPMELDPNRATFVIFVTDGAPTLRLTRCDVEDVDFADADGFQDMQDFFYRAYGVFGNGLSDIHNNNYNSALAEAESIVEHKKNLYSIGISSAVSELHVLENLAEDSGAGSEQSVVVTTQQSLIDAFDDIAARITGLLGYGDIAMTDGITDLSNTVMESASLLGVSDDFAYWKAPAPDNWSLMTKEDKAAYKPEDSDFEVWDPAAERCEPASYNTLTGAVEWQMGPNFVPEDGCTYKVTFSVWPSQEAYDWIADLKNGTKTWADVVEAGLDYPDGANPQIADNGGGSYSLATNKPGANTTYKSATKSGDTVTLGEDTQVLDFNTVEPMGLAERRISIRKRFAHQINNVSPFKKIEFTLIEDGQPYKKDDGSDYTIVLPTTEGADTEDYAAWQDEAYIAPGLIKTLSGDPGYQVLEKGHDYTLTERVIDGNAYEYQFTPQTVRPMVVGTELKYFVKKDTYNTNPDNKPEYTIDGGVYYELEEDAQALTGTNRKTAELDITKKVVDSTGRMTGEQLAAETFTYRITLTVPEGADVSGMMGYEYVPRPDDTVPGEPGRPRFYIFGYQGEEGGSPFPDDVETFRDRVYGGWNAQIYNLFGDSNTVTFDMTLDNDEMIRLTNLPQGTVYTITEYYANVNASDKGAPTPMDTRDPNVSAQGYTVEVRQDGSTTAEQTDTITGTITELDKRYYNQFTNTLHDFAEVELKGTKHLDGYAWSGERYYFRLSAGAAWKVDGSSNGTSPMPGNAPLGRDVFYLTDASGTADKTYSFGKIRFAEPGTYTYTISEMASANSDAAVLSGTTDERGVRYGAAETVTVTVGIGSDGKLVVESVVSSVNGTADEHTTFTPADETNPLAVSDTMITNTRILAKVKVLKIGDNQVANTLPDVSFELYETYVGPDSDRNVKAKKADGTDYGTLITGDDGTVVIDSLLPDRDGKKYYLVETQTSSGYNLLSKPVVITVYLTDEEPYYDVVYKTGSVASELEGHITPDAEGNCLITVNNTSGVELPQTGSTKALAFSITGFIMVLSVCAILIYRKKAEE